MFTDLDLDTDPRLTWWLEEQQAAKEANPLVGYCKRIYFVRKKCQRRNGPKKGSRRKYSKGICSEVELMRNLVTGKCVTVRDLRTPGLDALAEEVFADMVIPPDVNPSQLFLDYFRRLEPNK